MKELLSELFQTYYNDVYTYLYSLSRDASLSEDLASEVFLEVVKSISTFRGESDMKTWLFSIARHKWFGYLRKQKRQIRTECIHDLYDSEQLGKSDDINALSDLICSILSRESEQVRSIVEMRLEGFSYYEIASKTGLSENSARVIYFRMKAKIRKQLEKEGFRYE